jgi:hypothetical protein
MIPCVFALLTHKTKETYRNLITDLKDGAAKLKLKLSPVLVMIDFESAVIDSYIKQMTALALIPPNEVADAFVELSLHFFFKYTLIYLK